MIRLLLPFVVGTGWLVLETVVIGFFPRHYPPPDVVLILVIMFGFRYTPSVGGPVSFLLGLLQDALAGGTLGVCALSKTVVYAITTSMARRFYFSTIIAKIGMVLLGGIVDAVAGILLLSIGGFSQSISAVTHYQMLKVLLTGLLAPLVLEATTRVFALVERRDKAAYDYGSKEARTRRT